MSQQEFNIFQQFITIQNLHMLQCISYSCFSHLRISQEKMLKVYVDDKGKG